jgi:hypothetical protein
LDENVKQKILFEMSQIDEIIESTKPLRDLCKIRVPDIIEKSGSASGTMGASGPMGLCCKEKVIQYFHSEMGASDLYFRFYPLRGRKKKIKKKNHHGVTRRNTEENRMSNKNSVKLCVLRGKYSFPVV